MDWYEEYIEEPIREIVHKLRDNGINTECSCGHDMYIQCAFWDKDDILSKIYFVMCEFGIKNYRVEVREDIRDGYRFSSLDILLPDKNGIYSFERTENKNFIKNEI